MAKLDLPAGLTPKPTAAGTRYYWQPTPKQRKAGWKGLALGLDPMVAIAEAGKRNAEIEAWAAGGARPAAVKKILRRSTLPALIAQVKAEGWPSVKHPGKTLAEGTRKEYRSKFRTLEAWSGKAGDPPLSAFTPARVAVLRDALMAPARSGRRKGEVRHTTAHATLRVGSYLFTFAERKGLIPRHSNPFENFGLGTPEPRDQIWWPPAREALLEAASDCLSMALAADLAFATGQRKSDLLGFTLKQWREIEPFLIEDREIYHLLAQMPVPACAGRPGYVPGNVWGLYIRQAKTRRPVGVPIVGLTRARVEAAAAAALATGRTTILYDEESGLPWTATPSGKDAFTRRFAGLRAAAIAACRKAGDGELAAEIETLQYRDFRRTAAVTMAERGVSDINISAVTGWSLERTRKIVETYVPRTIGSAARAIALSQARASAQPVEQERKG